MAGGVSPATELEEEHSGEDGAFAELEKINKGEVARRLKELRPGSASPGNAKPQLGAKSKQAELGLGAPGLGAPSEDDEVAILKQWARSQGRRPPRQNGSLLKK
jgi:hypothetical protein